MSSALTGHIFLALTGSSFIILNSFINLY